MLKQKNKIWLIFLTAVFFLAACGGGGNGDGNGSEGASGDGEPTVLRVANGADPVTFDIQDTNDQATTRIAKQIYETLIFQTEDLELVPVLRQNGKRSKKISMNLN